MLIALSRAASLSVTDGWDTPVVGTLLGGLEPSKPELSITDADVTLGPLSEMDAVD